MFRHQVPLVELLTVCSVKQVSGLDAALSTTAVFLPREPYRYACKRYRADSLGDSIAVP